MYNPIRRRVAAAALGLSLGLAGFGSYANAQLVEVGDVEVEDVDVSLLEDIIDDVLSEIEVGDVLDEVEVGDILSSILEEIEISDIDVEVGDVLSGNNIMGCEQDNTVFGGDKNEQENDCSTGVLNNLDADVLNSALDDFELLTFEDVVNLEDTEVLNSALDDFDVSLLEDILNLEDTEVSLEDIDVLEDIIEDSELLNELEVEVLADISELF
jgi:hypothetical protein